MAIVFICGLIFFLVACIAALSTVNACEAQHRQKSEKAPSVAIPMTILMVVFTASIAAIVRLFWFSSIETLQANFILAMFGGGSVVAICRIMHDSIKKENSKYLVKQAVTAGTTTTVGRYESFDSALLKASQVIKKNRCSVAIVEDLSGNELAVINATAHAKHSQGARHG